MYRLQEEQYNEAQALVETLNHQLIALANSLEGRLSPSEEEILANLFQVHIGLQTAVDNIACQVEPPSTPGNGREVDSIAYAQAIQYARDLVTAIRQQKENQRRLELTAQQLIRAEKLATVGKVAATVAHELGNIFTPLLMYAKLIQEETAGMPGSDAAEFASQITKIAHRASNMLRQLVDASRSESNRMVLVDLPQVIQNTLTLLSPQVKDSGITIELDYPKGLPQIMGQADQLEQVFINIARNAFDAMPRGGTFTISSLVGNQMAEKQGANFVAIHFSDTGEGISPENIASVFEPFFTTKARGAGSGLGLFVSYLIINQHGGTIEVASEVGVGTTFTIKLPAA